MTEPHLSFGLHDRTVGRREVARVRLALPAKAILVTGHCLCVLDDLSQTGACVTIAEKAPPLHDGVVLMVDTITVFGTVVWRRGMQFGLHFEDRLDKAEVVRIRAVNDHYEALERDRRRRQARAFVQGQRGVL